jgi:uncharacterized membrane protein YphA (DoxX/SURF4 family)
MGKPIYVERLIEGSMDDLWRLTQQPKFHERWDLRFSSIEYVPRSDQHEVQRFHYTTRIGFGLAIQGTGETVGGRTGKGEMRTSALKFSSNDPKSLIEQGSGYWKYIPTQNGIRFLTRYDYHVRFGLIGRIVDQLLFRPLMGWATAWSFDRLALWIERGLSPEETGQQALLHALARLTVALIWLYQGLVPKLLYRHPDEVTLLQAAGINGTWLDPLLGLLGWAEVGLALLLVVCWRARWPLLATAILMILATVGVAMTAPAMLTAAFNPLTLNVAMGSLALIGYLCSANVPSARRCQRRQKEGNYAINL